MTRWWQPCRLCCLVKAISIKDLTRPTFAGTRRRRVPTGLTGLIFPGNYLTRPTSAGTRRRRVPTGPNRSNLSRKLPDQADLCRDTAPPCPYGSYRSNLSRKLPDQADLCRDTAPPCPYGLRVDFNFYRAGRDEAAGCGERREPRRSRELRSVPHRILRRYLFQQNLSRTGITIRRWRG